MSNINTVFVRGLLKLVHSEVKKAFPEIRNVVQCASVAGGNGKWFVQIAAAKRPVFNFDCRADSATHARYKAWSAFLDKYAPARADADA